MDSNLVPRSGAQTGETSSSPSDAGVTRAEELEEIVMLLEAEKTRIESQARASELFFTGVASQIQATVGSASVALEQLLSESMDERHLEAIRSVRTATQFAMRLVNDVLDLSRIKSGDLILAEKHYDFRGMLKALRSASSSQARAKGLRLVFQVDAALPHCLQGDEARLRQILQNIVGNAVKYTVRGQVSLYVSRDGDTARFDVADTGVGMDMEKAADVFNPIHTPLAGKGKKKGTGVGLTIARSLAELMGGSIMIDSVPGSGTRVHLHIPIVPGDPALIERRDVEAAGRRPSVLIVDDKARNLNLARQALEKMGYACDTAQSGAEALEKARKQAYSLILMDYAMPGMDRAEVAFAIRCVEKTRIPIIALATSPGAEETRKIFASGMDDILPKPVETDRLRQMLAKWTKFTDREDVPAPKSGSGTSLSMMTGSVSPSRPKYGVVEMAGNIGGLNVDMGLAMVAGQHGMYEDLLRVGGETLPGLVEKLVQAGRSGDHGQLRIELNGLEGSLYTLGAIALSEQARACEQELRKGCAQSCETKMEELLGGLRLFVNQLQRLFDGDVYASSVSYGDGAVLAGKLDRIMREMTQGNHVQVRRLVSLATQKDYGEAPRPALMEIKLLVNAGDYGKARDRIAALLRELPR